MPQIELLYNKGALIINPRRECTDKTLVVLGAARGGTSMVAGALHHLGVFMGEKLSAVYEDPVFSEAVECRDREALEALIAERNQTHMVWGWKRPASVAHAQVWRGRLRNPHYVVVFRDIFAIANRNRISMLSDVFADMHETLRHYGQILELVHREKAPALLVSYEKAMADPVNFVDELRAFAGVGDDRRVTDAIRFIQPNPEGYLLGSRITDSLGVVDLVSRKQILGWALYKGARGKPAQVRVAVNDGREYFIPADAYRRDLKEKSIHPTGHCGFVLKLSDDEALRPGDKVSVRVVGDVKDLKNSPKTFDGALPAKKRS